jgi:KUP system potassium uptake protein
LRLGTHSRAYTVFAGGTFALYSLLRQHVNFSGKSMPVPVTRLASDANLKFHSKKSSLQPRMLKFLEGSPIAQAAITYLVLVGTCMVMGDGALTPSISGIYLINLLHHQFITVSILR